MATKNGKSQLYWRVSLGISLILSVSTNVHAGDIDPSRYTPFVGDKFYLLSETTFSPDETALVRLEVPGRKDSLAAYSGVDVRIYKIPQPLDFLKKQKDLHRPNLKGNFAGEGVSNALSYLWDSWYKKSRLVWQRVVSSIVRKKAVEQNPDLKQTPPHTYQSVPDNNPQFKPIAGLEVIEEFRYPLWDAKPIAPPAGVALTGSSSNFLQVREGNVYIPVGQQKPGLYLVEAIIGTFRASTLLFISSTVAVTKLSSHQELVWTVDKKSGKPAPDTNIVFSDGVGVIGNGKTGADGVFVFEGKGLEKSYTIGQDRLGGVFISENFYYDSEIYGTKLFVFTDRPLYRPGDNVNIKILGREFSGSDKSASISNGGANISVIDSEGTVLINKQVDLVAENNGGSTSFKLPEFSRPGGYTLQINYKQTQFTSAFRVANYVKPHFEVDIGFQKKEYKTGEPIKGKVSLNYPNGEAVKGSKVEVEIRKQRLTIVAGELEYVDKFPVRLSKNTFSTNEAGVSEFDIPAATEPSRLIVSVRAVDNASYRVTSTKEILVQTTANPLMVSSERQFSKPKESVNFKIGSATGEKTSSDQIATDWEAIRLQDQSVFKGKVKDGQKDFSISFERAGAYTIILRSKDGMNLSSANHWVQGPELARTPGSISILSDKIEYDPNETAKILFTFSEDIGEALVTLERDKVEQKSLIGGSANWIKLKKISAREYSGDIQIQEGFGPNITLSVVYVSKGHYFFENKGLKVSIPKIQISFRPEKKVYKPGETVNVSVITSIKNKPVAAALSISVVDEMIYLLQPEIAPDISEFFFHPRRNQVRTSSSLNFHSYDVAVSATGANPSASSSQYSERSLKLRDRPRRDDKDTAYWSPLLKTDKSGQAKFSFVMPDSLTRWRMTARAISPNGQVGQNKDFINSQKDVYIKWSGPTRFRSGDTPSASLALFNLTNKDKKITLESKGYGKGTVQELNLKTGTSYVQLPIRADKDGRINLSLSENKKTLDELSVGIQVSPVEWVSTQSVKISTGSNIVPAGAFNLRLSAASDAGESLLRAVDYLVDYPYGCVEQTSSRVLPLAMALSQVKQFGFSASVSDRLTNRLTFDRLRLIKMAGPEAMFSWWGDQASSSAFMTTYAYYADWMASKTIGINLPQSHWEYVLEAYKKFGDQEPLLSKVLILWMSEEMGLPVKTLTQGVVDNWTKITAQGPMFNSDIGGEQITSLILLGVVSKKSGISLPPDLLSKVEAAKKQALSGKSAMATSAYILSKRGAQLSDEDSTLAQRVLNDLLTELPTIERSLSLAFIFSSISTKNKSMTPANFNLGADWTKSETSLGRQTWQYRGSTSLKSIPESALKSGGSLHLVYDSFKNEPSALPIQIERKLFKLTQKATSSDKNVEFEVGPVIGDWSLSTKDIYLDEITVTPQSGVFQFGLIEAALPPGGEIEQTTWGMTIKGQNGAPISVDSSGLQEGDRSYSMAIEKLDSPKTFRHLIRFGQSGNFTVPPVRYFKMYTPIQKAFEGGVSSAAKKIIIH